MFSTAVNPFTPTFQRTAHSITITVYTVLIIETTYSSKIRDRKAQPKTYDGFKFRNLSL